MKRAGIFIHSRWTAAQELAREVTDYLRQRDIEVWQTADWEDHALAEQVEGTDLLLCLGGDGTMLRAARTVVPHEIPLLGVNMGRLGFLAEVRPADLLERLPDVIAGRYRVERRAMLQAQVPAWGATFHALNDIVVGRTSVGRPVYVDVSIDGSRLAIHRCDAMIVSSATGSTAYSLSAGGPILHPESKDLILNAVAPHLTGARPLVLPPWTVIDLMVTADKEAVVSIDGQIDREMNSGDRVSVCRSPHEARFVRFSRPQEYYEHLAERLDWLRVLRASENAELFEIDGIPAPQ